MRQIVVSFAISVLLASLPTTAVAQSAKSYRGEVLVQRFDPSRIVVAVSSLSGGRTTQLFFYKSERPSDASVDLRDPQGRVDVSRGGLTVVSPHNQVVIQLPLEIEEDDDAEPPAPVPAGFRTIGQLYGIGIVQQESNVALDRLHAQLQRTPSPFLIDTCGETGDCVLYPDWWGSDGGGGGGSPSCSGGGSGATSCSITCPGQTPNSCSVSCAKAFRACCGCGAQGASCGCY